jgi:hypothetical protein
MDTPQRVTDAVGVLPSHAAAGGGSGRKTGSDGGHVSWAVVRRVGRLFLPYWVPLVAVFGVLVVNAYFDSLSACLFPSRPSPPFFPSRIVLLFLVRRGFLFHSRHRALTHRACSQ